MDRGQRGGGIVDTDRSMVDVSATVSAAIDTSIRAMPIKAQRLSQRTLGIRLVTWNPDLLTDLMC